MVELLKFTITTLIALSLVGLNAKAQTIAPLRLGNLWIYDRISTTARTTVVDTAFYIDTIPYCKLFIEVNYGATGNAFVRLKEEGFFVLYNEFDSTEAPYYKQNAVIGDTWTVDPFVYTIENTFESNVFGEQTIVKFLTIDGGILLIHEYWTEKFGKLSSSQFPNPWPMEQLLGCVIDGVAYGDTSFSIVSVDDETVSPNEFYLAQNYPNPFNPTTKIKYTIPGNVILSEAKNLITLKVYDLLGKEVATLVNEEQSPGTYEVEFNANSYSRGGSSLPSGVYFYQLRTGNFSVTKKMILLK